MPPVVGGESVSRSICGRLSSNALAQEVSEQKSSEDGKSGEEIYIGFEKGDYAPRTGRKGRVVKDDPEKYPDRSALTGGWAGGEVGLKQFVKVRFPTGDPARLQQKAILRHKACQRKITRFHGRIRLVNSPA